MPVGPVDLHQLLVVRRRLTSASTDSAVKQPKDSAADAQEAGRWRSIRAQSSGRAQPGRKWLAEPPEAPMPLFKRPLEY
jgi:hypothetical protein